MAFLLTPELFALSCPDPPGQKKKVQVPSARVQIPKETLLHLGIFVLITSPPCMYDT
jgi:hypothetical protein